MGTRSKNWSLVCSLVLVGACASEAEDVVTPDPMIEEAAAEHGIPVEVLEAVGLPRTMDPRATAAVLADCATETDVRGEDFAEWTPALDCMAELQVEVDVHLHDFGGVQSAPNEISWVDGDDDATLTIPALKKVAEGTPNCPSGSFCFWDGASYNGKRIRYSGGTRSGNFSTYGMRDKISSWQNRSSSLRHVFNRSGWYGINDYILWTMWGTYDAPTRSSYVGSSRTNRADYFSR